MSTRSRMGFSSLAVLMLTVLAASCSNQGEGERCDTSNGNLDCQSGLFCRRISGAQYDLCCPASDQTPTAPACSNVVVSATADAAAEAAVIDSDGAASEAGASDVATDATDAAELDASSDASETGTAP